MPHECGIFRGINGIAFLIDFFDFVFLLELLSLNLSFSPQVFLLFSDKEFQASRKLFRFLSTTRFSHDPLQHLEHCAQTVLFFLALFTFRSIIVLVISVADEGHLPDSDVLVVEELAPFLHPVV